ncbi:periplasmic thiol:disulfide interchange protein DsbA [Photobacterium aphoticum]|uniref:Periplasmic thiol:disulfide interchange protein DsbA n=1 Tax=Photobacterium aphoticum TaxID=754436 RepID=A0A090R1U7_9GAMM|nr:periplasmic thiol:disulfide interchange protein DsbA [Photobacterium aphoticum]
MFKKFFVLLSAILFSVSVQAAQFKEGDHYKVLDLPKSSSPLVTEFYSFYCPACNRFEPMIQELKKTLPDNAKFQKNHVSFMGGSMGESMSKAYATAVVLGVEDKITLCCLPVSMTCKSRHVTMPSYVRSLSTKA